jgi:hypothetical protein
MLIVLRRELIVFEDCNSVASTLLIKPHTCREDLDGHIGIVPKLHREHVPREVPGWRRD